ncbi:hypothetical protein CEXT_583701 [Caerostris extrusa]|uniref:Uncharacterized protein n=1 Tax=Caerostris extrusa TaxID=172846 RepID=A0AAV4SM50_CAEEX|nr:hypothetical protein CEXT_583701 [Caerostris extrusa]
MIDSQRGMVRNIPEILKKSPFAIESITQTSNPEGTASEYLKPEAKTRQLVEASSINFGHESSAFVKTP